MSLPPRKQLVPEYNGPKAPLPSRQEPLDADLAAGLRSEPEPPPTVNPTFTPKRRKRPKRQYESVQKADAVIRQIDGLAVDFVEGREDCESLEWVVRIEQAAARLKDAALEGLHASDYGYSNAAIAQALGVSRQAVSQRRRRR